MCRRDPSSQQQELVPTADINTNSAHLFHVGGAIPEPTRRFGSVKTLNENCALSTIDFEKSDDFTHSIAPEIDTKSHFNNTFIAYSTLPGQSAARDEIKGTLFVYHLIRTLRANFQTCDINRIMIKVNNEMKVKEQSIHLHSFGIGGLVYLRPNVSLFYFVHIFV
jgi:hypothetical protein